MNDTGKHFDSPWNHKLLTRGFTLIEMLLVLGILSILTVGSLIGYHVYSQRQSELLATQDTRDLALRLSSTYGQSGSFEGLTSANLIQGKMVPHNLGVQGGTIKNSWGGTVDVQSADPDDLSYAITWSKVPAGACAQMVSHLSGDFSDISVNGVNVTNSTSAVEPGQIAKNCALGNNTLVMTSNLVSGGNSIAAAASESADNQPLGQGRTPFASGQPVSSPGFSDTPSSTPPSVALTAKSGSPGRGMNVTGISAGENSSTEGRVLTGISTKALVQAQSLPAQSCFPSQTPATESTTETQSRTTICPGSNQILVEQQTRTKMLTTLTSVSCNSIWSAPITHKTIQTSYSDWSEWSAIGGVCQ